MTTVSSGSFGFTAPDYFFGFFSTSLVRLKFFGKTVPLLNCFFADICYLDGCVRTNFPAEFSNSAIEFNGLVYADAC